MLHQKITEGGELMLEMGGAPNKNWGVDLSEE